MKVYNKLEYFLEKENVRMAILGWLIILFGCIDLILGNFMGIDLTGVYWSPIAAGIIGGALVQFDNRS
jgi:hypothetical protein